MLADEILQNGNEVVVAHKGLACGVDVLGLDIAVAVYHQLVGKAVALGVRLAVAVAVHHVGEVVDHGLRQHDGLLALRQHDGFDHELFVALQIGLGGDEAVEVHQNIAVVVQLGQNLGEFSGGDEILVVAAAELGIRLGSGHVLNEHMEAQVGDQGGILVFYQGALGGFVFCTLAGNVRMLGQVAYGFQLFNGLS